MVLLPAGNASQLKEIVILSVGGSFESSVDLVNLREVSVNLCEGESFLLFEGFSSVGSLSLCASSMVVRGNMDDTKADLRAMNDLVLEVEGRYEGEINLQASSMDMEGAVRYS